jgi:hypothetical protein
MLTIMERNRNAINTELATLAFYMEGGMTFNDAHALSAEQRQAISKVIEKHYTTMNKKSGGLTP